MKIDGKEAAVIGSRVTTCNDMGERNNSVIMAVGMSIPMPEIVNPLNSEEWKRERGGSQKKEPKFSSVKWAKTSCKEGEEIEFSAGVKDIADGNMVTLQVFREGQSPEDSAAIAKFPHTVKDGVVSAKWLYRADRSVMPPEQNPRFIFTAHCAWCNFKKSDNTLEVELKRPEITKAEWQDKGGKTASKGTVGAPIKLYCEVTEFEEGQGVTFTVYDGQTQKTVYEAGADVKDGKAEAQWNPIDTRNPEDTEELKYYIEATSLRCKPVKSGDIQVKNPKVISMEWDKKALYYGDKATLKIRTFELSDEKPVCKLQLWEKDYTTEDDFIFEHDITIDSDEVETEIEFDFPLDKFNLTDKNFELQIYSRLLLDEKCMTTKNTSIFVGVGFIYG